MAYDENLADRIRELVGAEAGVVGASRLGGLLVRVDPDEQDARHQVKTKRTKRR